MSFFPLESWIETDSLDFVQVRYSIFLKYAIFHPAVTAAIPATTNPDHVAENIGALRGALSDTAMRERMVNHMESIPGFDRLTQTAWYPGKQFSGQV